MSIDIGSFEQFLLFWKSKVNSDSPLYKCADTIWHEFQWGQTTTERRQNLGIVSWVIWWFRAAFQSLTTTHHKSARYYSFTSPTFVFLGTPAHQETLAPICRELPDKAITKLTTVGQPVDSVDVLTIPEQAPNLFKAIAFLLLTLRGVSLASEYFRAHGHTSNIRLKGRLAQKLYACLNAIDWCARLPKPSAPLFLTYELMPFQKGLVRQWRKSGNRVLHLMHGQRLDFYQYTSATDLVLLSKIDEPWFRARVDPNVRLWTIGHPRLEDVRRKVGPAHSQHDRLPRITFFSQPSEGDYTRDLRIADWRICVALKGRAEVRFRAHPREDINKIKAEMAAAGIDFMQISDAGLIEDLTWCDAVASSWSTVSMEAAACGRGIFWTCSTPKRYEATQELRDHGIGTLVQSAQGWETPLAEWQCGEWCEPIRVSEARLRELGMIGDMEKSWFERLEIKV